ncbi:MAG: hypothetical protein A2365_03640 [Candidatus Nealsonbacteria bacterium RIFOXYB1_FULL_40_15]|uniref:Uncharacterized protein n=2 Tax=Candidatus Nealsoniibacteriota TaxID=1817911 RepID=A0A1G2ERG9_9BACT|nr:MAG: hypothetical protein A2365_03640 [Candidatus Nealsonbacteria bacterium RIFOXYB1_FULL_40_15]OGZ28394.1 MAG: hypothetical protein A2427_01325 [Candidatus Nealsonbacteria bacterium RIFOXYC1_FULL_40_7]OGZ29520.1 MAG: hypothetical protein A2562_02410 [Candidatus Nealsonbacteria bacterium RIFOXYD1_FULL_39_11]
MDKLEAIRLIAYADDVVDSSKLAGIRQVLEEDEGSARAIAIAYSKPRTQAIRETKGKKMKCKEEGCGGEVDMNKPVSLQVGCRASRNAYPCKKCNRLHFGDGSLVFTRGQQKAFYEGGSVK